MDTRSRAASSPRSYQDFEPSSEWVRDDKSETLLIKLPGFKKEQMKVQIDSHRNLRTSGERPIEGNNNRWSRFCKDIHIPENLNLTGIRAKFENETLYVIIPKLNMTTPPEPQPQPTQAQEPLATLKNEPDPVEASKEKEKDQLIKEHVDHDAEKVDDHGGEKLVDNHREKEQQAEEGGRDGIGSRWLRKKAMNGGGGVMEKHRQLLLNAVMALFLLVALAMYVAYQAKRELEDESYARYFIN